MSDNRFDTVYRILESSLWSHNEAMTEADLPTGSPKIEEAMKALHSMSQSEFILREALERITETSGNVQAAKDIARDALRKAKGGES